MKWTKFDPENPPVGRVLFRFQYPYGINYNVGYWTKYYGCTFYGLGETINYTVDEMQTYNSHYIYPQDLEMPE